MKIRFDTLRPSDTAEEKLSSYPRLRAIKQIQTIGNNLYIVCEESEFYKVMKDIIAVTGIDELIFSSGSDEDSLTLFDDYRG